MTNQPTNQPTNPVLGRSTAIAGRTGIVDPLWLGLLALSMESRGKCWIYHEASIICLWYTIKNLVLLETRENEDIVGYHYITNNLTISWVQKRCVFPQHGSVHGNFDDTPSDFGGILFSDKVIWVPMESHSDVFFVFNPSSKYDENTIVGQNSDQQLMAYRSYGKCPIYRLFKLFTYHKWCFFHSYVKLPKGNSIDPSFRATLSLPWWTMTLTRFSGEEQTRTWWTI